MHYKLAADFLVLIHFGFIIFVVLGGLLVLRWSRVAWVHIPTVAWGAWIEFTHSVCPLTPMEQGLRELAGTTNYRGGFIDHYIIPIVYPPGFSPETAQLLAFAVLSVNLIIYAAVIYRRYRIKGDPPINS